MAKKFTPEQTLHLVNLYREHECLWNIHLDTYKNSHYKNRALQQMCADLNIKGFTVDDLKIKIKTIRSTYCIELDKIEKTAGTEFVYKPRVIWFDALNSFIREVTMKKKRATDASDPVEYKEEFTQKEENSESEPLDDRYCDDDIDRTQDISMKYEDQDPLAKAAYEILQTEPSGSTTQTRKRKIYQLDSTTNTVKLLKEEEGTERILQVETESKLRRIAPKPSEKYAGVAGDHTYHAGVNNAQTIDGAILKFTAEDEFDTFGKHVANQLRKLSSIKYILAQEDIQSTITKFLMEDING